MYEENLPEIAKVGELAPDFTVDAVTGDKMHEVSLSDFRGKWTLLFFYPLDFTFVCPTELRELQAHKEDFKKLGVEVLPISVDSVFSHMAWRDSTLDAGDFAFTWLADTTHDVARLYDVLIEDKGVALRGTFIIDPEGMLRASIVTDDKIGRSVPEILRLIEAAQTGERCPANWHKGEKTI